MSKLIVLNLDNYNDVFCENENWYLLEFKKLIKINLYITICL
jgi:hypothetical protein